MMEESIVPPEYAYAWVRVFLDTPLLRANGVQVAMKAMMVDVRKKKTLSAIWKDGKLCVSEEGPDEERNAKDLVQWAMKDKVAFDAAVKLGAEYLGRNEPVPSALSIFLSGYLTRSIKRPNQSGPHRSKNYYRDRLICQSIDVLLELGFKRTRNNATKVRESAYDIVSDALKPHNIHLSPDAISAVWETMSAEEKILR